jgi:hypothetical protein
VKKAPPISLRLCDIFGIAFKTKSKMLFFRATVHLDVSHSSYNVDKNESLANFLIC